MSSRQEFEELLAEYFIEMGLTRLSKYASSDQFGQPMSFQIDYSGRVWGRYINRYFSLYRDHEKHLHYVYSIYRNTRWPGPKKLLKNLQENVKDDDNSILTVENMIHEEKYLLGRCRIDFHAPDSFDNLTAILIKSESEHTKPFTL